MKIFLDANILFSASFPNSLLSGFLGNLEELAELISSEYATVEAERNLCGAIAAKADFLLTGDKKDFGHLFGKRVGGVKIVTVSMLVEELQRFGFLEI